MAYKAWLRATTSLKDATDTASEVSLAHSKGVHLNKFPRRPQYCDAETQVFMLLQPQPEGWFSIISHLTPKPRTYRHIIDTQD